ncbi:MAG: response regulator [Thermodesulfobacteriota bacterium]
MLAHDPILSRIGVSGNPGAVHQVILNLVSNASHAMPEGGQLTISTANVSISEKVCPTCGETYSGDWVTLTISDSGHGINPDDLPRIFDPFFTTKAVGKGTGLGLSTVHGIILGHGGHVECQSQLGQGATFTVYLPAYLGAAEAGGNGSAAELANHPGGNEKILLVDDEGSLREFAARTLKSMGYEVTTAGSGEEALEIFRQRDDQLDLVIMDLGMPGMGGHKALRAMLEHDPTAKIIVASGYSATGRAKGALDDGAVDYVGKPFKKAQLLATVRRVLDKN